MFNLGSGIVDPSIIVTTSGLFLTAVKLMFIVAGMIYLIFSVIIIRQVRLMQSTIMTSLSIPLIFIGIVHAVLALLAFLFYLAL